jgi:NTP pyrophosphatase (non-canonical NTP hydrolase)
MSTSQEELLLVDRMADNMRMKLFANRERPHWKGDHLATLHFKLREEVKELIDAVIEGEDAWAEAADVANFAAMIADNADKGGEGLGER